MHGRLHGYRRVVHAPAGPDTLPLGESKPRRGFGEGASPPRRAKMEIAPAQFRRWRGFWPESIIIGGMISDYGNIHVSSRDYVESNPTDMESAIGTWREALAKGANLRVRGSGHGLSGCTLPRKGEVLLRTRGLDQYRVEAPGELTVGGGAVLWDIRDFLFERGWQLPVYNGGWAGPTLGGFINAGGMPCFHVSGDGSMEPNLRDFSSAPDSPPGERRRSASVGFSDLTDPVSVSELYGGLWAHLARIKLIDGRGNVHEFLSGDDEFPWLFAAMGQFGLILEATLALRPQPAAAEKLAAGESGRVPSVNTVDANQTDALSAVGGAERIYWFTALIPVDEEDAAWDVIDRWWKAARQDVLRHTGGRFGPVRDDAPIGYRYLVPRMARTPPLLYPRDEDFVAMGVMAICDAPGTDRADAVVTRAAREFAEQISGRGWSLYCQAENPARAVDFPKYWGAARWRKFCDLKSRFDPDSRINVGDVQSGGPSPLQTATRLRRRAAAMRRALGLS